MRRPLEDWIDITSGFDVGSAGSADRPTAAAFALKAGSRAPEFRLSDHDGKIVSLADRLRTGPAVLSFLGGERETGLSGQLQTLAAQSPEILRYDASVLAISPLAQQPCPQPVRGFNLLHDAGSAVAAAYGLCPPPSAARPLGPAPATFVVDQNAKIVMSLVDAPFDSDIVPTVVLGTLAALRQRGSRKP